jgi:hypothetical protein
MQTRIVDGGNLGPGEDWAGNNVAFACPVPNCGKVYLVSGMMHRGGRECPACRGSKGFVSGGKDSGGTARIQWRTA